MGGTPDCDEVVFWNILDLDVVDANANNVNIGFFNTLG